VRIISGTYRGKLIHPPRGFKARPTTDFAKEGLFNVLGNHYEFEELDVLDLFSGTGSITYEFASRGAGSVVAVESDALHFKFIRSSCSQLGFDQVTVLHKDAFRYLMRPIQSFDIVFADPPFDHPRLTDLPELVLAGSLLNSGGLFILEHPENFSFVASPGFRETRKYGRVNFSFFDPLSD
jgi:16S rRNA (guanine(966)-N(2))-methyltransferase RsmD